MLCDACQSKAALSHDTNATRRISRRCMPICRQGITRYCVRAEREGSNYSCRALLVTTNAVNIFIDSSDSSATRVTKLANRMQKMKSPATWPAGARIIAVAAEYEKAILHVPQWRFANQSQLECTYAVPAHAAVSCALRVFPTRLTRGQSHLWLSRDAGRART